MQVAQVGGASGGQNVATKLLPRHSSMTHSTEADFACAIASAGPMPTGKSSRKVGLPRSSSL